MRRIRLARVEMPNARCPIPDPQNAPLPSCQLPNYQLFMGLRTYIHIYMALETQSAQWDLALKTQPGAALADVNVSGVISRSQVHCQATEMPKKRICLATEQAL